MFGCKVTPLLAYICSLPTPRQPIICTCIGGFPSIHKFYIITTPPSSSFPVHVLFRPLSASHVSALEACHQYTSSTSSQHPHLLLSMSVYYSGLYTCTKDAVAAPSVGFFTCTWSWEGHVEKLREMRVSSIKKV